MTNATAATARDTGPETAPSWRETAIVIGTGPGPALLRAHAGAVIPGRGATAALIARTREATVARRAKAVADASRADLRARIGATGRMDATRAQTNEARRGRGPDPKDVAMPNAVRAVAAVRRRRTEAKAEA